MGRRIDLTGKRFGRLTAISFAGTNDAGDALWKVRCDCGVEFQTLGAFLTSGRTKSCGCYRSECTANRNRIIKRKGYEQGGVHRQQ